MAAPPRIRLPEPPFLGIEEEVRLTSSRLEPFLVEPETFAAFCHKHGTAEGRISVEEHGFEMQTAGHPDAEGVVRNLLQLRGNILDFANELDPTWDKVQPFVWSSVPELEDGVYTGFHGHHYNAVDAARSPDIAELGGVLARHAFLWIPLSFNSAFTSRMEVSSALVQRHVAPLARVRPLEGEPKLRLELRSPDVQADVERIKAGMALFQCLVWRWRKEQSAYTFDWLDNDAEAEANMLAVRMSGRAARVQYGGKRGVPYAEVMARLVDDLSHEGAQLGVRQELAQCVEMARHGGSEGEKDIETAISMFGHRDKEILYRLAGRAMWRYRKATAEGMRARGMPLPKSLADFER